MAHTLKTLGVLGALLCLLGMTACGAAPPTSTPTIDLDPFRTEVAATVLAQVEQTQSAVPSATPMPSPTATLTLTPAPTTTQPLTPSPSAAATIASVTPITGANQAQWVSQSINDGTVFAPGETFTMTWRLKNVGTTTWTTAYRLRFYSGNAFGAPTEVPLNQDVAPAGTADIALKMKAPSQPGEYRSDWVLSDANRSNFKQPVFLKITVATATSTPTRTATPTLTATP